ncbi:MAG: hypothetical protein D3910_03200 [Candidatus Electrothrix sp. ATG2]|nr:hypothetical protein [Candidatus Electrothrix sp. ATG2]
MKLRSHVMLLWTCLVCILLATIYFLFTQLIYRHYHEQVRMRIERGTAALEQKLKEGGDDLAHSRLAERITPKFLDHLAHESECDIYLYTDAQVFASRLTADEQPLFLEIYSVGDLPVLSVGTEQWQTQQIKDENNIIYGARLLLQEKEHAVLLFVCSLDFVRQGVAVLGEVLVMVFIIVFTLLFPVAAFFLRSSVSKLLKFNLLQDRQSCDSLNDVVD